MTDKNSSDEMIKKESRKLEIETLTNEIFSKDSISGDDLKKMRKAAGIELSEINAVTKISVSVLKSMEENRIENLPPSLYLKNFLRRYAEILQIDPQKVIDGYLKNISLAITILKLQIISKLQIPMTKTFQSLIGCLAVILSVLNFEFRSLIFF